jgi:hypothetical protein
MSSERVCPTCGHKGPDKAHLAFLAGLLCCVGSCSAPSGPPHHLHGGQGTSLKHHDHMAMPMCVKHHRQFHDAKGRFFEASKADRQSWQQRQVEDYHPKEGDESYVVEEA